MVKQVIAVRKDLNMRKGKIAAQVAHAAMKVFLDRSNILQDTDGQYYMDTSLTKTMANWLEGPFTKVVVEVESVDELYKLAKRATELNIPHAIMIDNGNTEFHDKKTETCIAIGPDESGKIDLVTGGLKLI